MSDGLSMDFEHLIGRENLDTTADPPVLRPADEEQLCGVVVLAAGKTRRSVLSEEELCLLHPGRIITLPSRLWRFRLSVK